MFCTNCGAKYEESHRFCFNCGAPLPKPAIEPVFEAADPVVEDSLDTHEQIEIEESIAIEEPAELGAEEPVPPSWEALIEEPTPAYEPPLPKKGRLWPAFVIMAIMSIVGIVVFFSTQSNSVVDPSAPWFSIEDGVLSFDEAYYFGPSELEIPEVVGGQTVIALSDGCFADCDTLTTVILPDTLKTIGARAFADCSEMRGILIPKSVESIGTEAFASCNSLEAILIQSTIRSIGENAFDRCLNLNHVIFGGSVSQWELLYNGIMGSDTLIHCTDGTYQYSVKE